MARRNPFANVMSGSIAEDDNAVLNYTNKGASKALITSLDELTAQADRLLEGETVVELDPEIIDRSFVSDRLEEDESDFEELLKAIRHRGQDSPILVRPHPSGTGRYMVIFGHRRLRVASVLHRKVRAVVKDLKDSDHVVAQGQENAARANLSFIEKATFAAEIARRKFDGDNAIVLSALSIDRATLSKMLAVSTIPKEILSAVGAAKGIGRDRWYELKNFLDRPSAQQEARVFIETDEFKGKAGEDRFNSLLAFVKTAGRSARPKTTKRHRWASDDNALSANITSDGKTYTFALKSLNAVGFGDFLAENLGELYQEYRTKLDQQGA